MSVRILLGDCRQVLKTLADESVHTVVTSPPYFGLRDYGTASWEGGDPACSHTVGGQVQDRKAPGAITSGVRPGVDASRCRSCGAERVDSQIGLEPSLDEFIAEMVAVFREVRRVLRSDGTLWLNLGDSYAGSWGAQSRGEAPGPASQLSGGQVYAAPKGTHTGSMKGTGLKPKDLMGVPWRVALALQADGWWLRQDIIWAKPNPMPESVRDRCTKSHEYLFLLSKSERYHYDADAIAEPLGEASVARLSQNVEAQAGSDRVPGKTNGAMKAVGGRRAAGNKTHKGQPAYEEGEERFRTKAGLVSFAERERAKVEAGDLLGTRNKRTVWTVATQPFKEAHFATYPPELIEPCILAGCPVGGTVLDPFGGSGTTGLVAARLGRDAILIELNPEYAALADRRLRAGLAQVEGDCAADPSDLPLFAGEAA